MPTKIAPGNSSAATKNAGQFQSALERATQQNSKPADANQSPTAEPKEGTKSVGRRKPSEIADKTDKPTIQLAITQTPDLSILGAPFSAALVSPPPSSTNVQPQHAGSSLAALEKGGPGVNSAIPIGLSNTTVQADFLDVGSHTTGSALLPISTSNEGALRSSTTRTSHDASVTQVSHVSTVDPEGNSNPNSTNDDSAIPIGITPAANLDVIPDPRQATGLAVKNLDEIRSKALEFKVSDTTGSTSALTEGHRTSSTSSGEFPLTTNFLKSQMRTHEGADGLGALLIPHAAAPEHNAKAAVSNSVLQPPPPEPEESFSSASSTADGDSTSLPPNLPQGVVMTTPAKQKDVDTTISKSDGEQATATHQINISDHPKAKASTNPELKKAITPNTGALNQPAISDTEAGKFGNAGSALSSAGQTTPNKPDLAHLPNEHGANDIAIDASARIEQHLEHATAYPGTLFQSTKLIERLGQLELRVGIPAGEFGNVDIRTSLGRNQFTAQISVERGELSKVLATELPALQNRLSEHRLPNAQISLENHFGGGSNSSDQGWRQDRIAQRLTPPSISGDEAVLSAIAVPEGDTSPDRLDIHM